MLSFNGLLDNPRARRARRAQGPGCRTRRPDQRHGAEAGDPAGFRPELPDARETGTAGSWARPEQMGAGDATTLLSAATACSATTRATSAGQRKPSASMNSGSAGERLGDTGGPPARSAGWRAAAWTPRAAPASRFSRSAERLSSNALLSYGQTLGRAEGIVKLTVNLSRQIAIDQPGRQRQCAGYLLHADFRPPGNAAERSRANS